MEDCKYFESELMDGIPYRFRSHVEDTLRSLQESKVMLHLFSQALRYACKPKGKHLPPDAVVSIGSFGRLDGCASVSDFDILYLYEGSPNKTRVDEIRNLITDIVCSNKAFSFDHRQEIEAGGFIFDSSPAYPVISFEEIIDPTNETRALQLLTEGRVILGRNEVDGLRKTLIENLGYSANIHNLDLGKLRNAVDRLKNEFCKGVMGRLRADKRELTNRKILKLFALREFYYLSTVFAIADICMGFLQGSQHLDKVFRTLSGPSMIKICALGDSTGSLAMHLRTLKPELQKEVWRLLGNAMNEMKLSSRLAVTDPDLDMFGALRALCLDVLGKFSALLRLLHDEDFLQVIDPLEPDVTTWISRRQFKDILQLRAEMVDAAKHLAVQMIRILEFLREVDNKPIYNLSIDNLAAIRDYAMVLA